jgi:hypothetical protein
MYADRLNENRLARRDAILIHYIRNHPEDFPVTGRYFKNIFVFFLK